MEDLIWVQEEPANQGSWPYVALNLPEHLEVGTWLRRVSRAASAAPAAGSHNLHEVEQQALLDQAFA
jgi:2-oxoglutarate dehydrogenase E1 component